MSILHAAVFPDGDIKAMCLEKDRNNKSAWAGIIRIGNLDIHLMHTDTPVLKQAIAELEKHHEPFGTTKSEHDYHGD